MGPDPADRIRASGHVRRTKRPDTWQHPTSLHQRHKISCQQGAVHTWDPTPRIALGPAAMYAAPKGRTHGSTRPACINVTKSLANREPSTHVRRTKRPDTWQHPTSLHQRHKISCQQGAVHTCTPHQKAGHMAAPDQLASTSQNLLPTGSRPHMAIGGASQDGWNDVREPRHAALRVTSAYRWRASGCLADALHRPRLPCLTGEKRTRSLRVFITDPWYYLSSREVRRQREYARRRPQAGSAA